MNTPALRRVEVPFAFCCAEGGGRVDACDCVNKNHGKAFVDSSSTFGKRLTALDTVYASINARQAAVHLLDGGDYVVIPMPGQPDAMPAEILDRLGTMGAAELWRRAK